MAIIGSYNTREFSEGQKFLVIDPATGTTSLVKGSDLVSYISPSLNSVKVETTTDAALYGNYKVGQVIQTTGGSMPGDGKAGLFLVVGPGEGEATMFNGNELLVIAGDAFLRQELGSGIRRVDSLAGLQAISGRFSGDVAYMVGRTTAGDGGEGEFRWDGSDLSASVSADTQQGVYVAPTSAPTGASGAWVRQYSGALSVTWFGAAGDGATDDRMKIQAAFDYLSPGQKLVFPGGYDFRIVNATGSGADIVARRADAVLNATLFAVTSSANDIKVEINGTISGTSPLDDIVRLSGNGVVIFGTGIVRNTSGEFLDTNSSDTVVQWSPANIRINGDKCTIFGIEVVDQVTSGILDAGNNNLIFGCKFNGGPTVHGPGTRQFGVEQTVSGTIRKGGIVDNCRFYKSASGGACYSGVFSVCQNARITSNYFDGLLEHGVYANAVENIISGNTFKEIDLASAVQSFNGGTITNNRFVDCAFGQIQVQRPNNTIISGNTAKGAQLSGIAVRAGTGDASSVVYRNLLISENTIEFSGAQSAIDIALESSIYGVKVLNNIIENSAGSSTYGPVRVEVTAAATVPGQNIEFYGNTINGSEIYGLYLKRFKNGKVSGNTFIDCNRTLSITAARFFDCENIEFKDNTAINDLSANTAQIFFAGGGVGDNNLNIQAFGNNGINLAAGTSPLCAVPVPGVAVKNGVDSFGSEGFFTAANLASDTINTGAATSCKPSAEVLLTPLNAAATTIQTGAQRIAVTTKNDGSFVWSTNSGAAIGTASASYKYEIVDN